MSRNNNCDVLTELTMHILRYLDTALDTDPIFSEYTQLFRILGSIERVHYRPTDVWPHRNWPQSSALFLGIRS